MEMEKHLKATVVASGALFEDGKLLLLKRPKHKKMFPGQWEIPGGKLNERENPEQAVKRELLEELDLEVEVNRPFATMQWSKDGGEYFEIDYLITAKNPVKLNLKEHDEC